VPTLQGIAAIRLISLEQLALEHLNSLVDENNPTMASSTTALLQAMKEPPHLSSEDVDALDAAIESARIPLRVHAIF
jgi:hypothetical protein